jgi:hypothetical protein
MKQRRVQLSSDELMAEIARQALVLARGTERIEQTHAKRSTITRIEFDVTIERIIAETADEYGSEFDDNHCREQMFDNAELPN